SCSRRWGRSAPGRSSRSTVAVRRRRRVARLETRPQAPAEDPPKRSASRPDPPDLLACAASLINGLSLRILVPEPPRWAWSAVRYLSIAVLLGLVLQYLLGMW